MDLTDKTTLSTSMFASWLQKYLKSEFSIPAHVLLPEDAVQAAPRPAFIRSAQAQAAAALEKKLARVWIGF